MYTALIYLYLHRFLQSVLRTCLLHTSTRNKRTPCKKKWSKSQFAKVAKESPRKVPWDRQIFGCHRFPPGHIRGPRQLRECPPSSRILYLEDYSVQQLSNKILLIFHKADLSCIGLKISSLNANTFSNNHIVVSRTDKKMTKKRHNKTFTLILYHPFQNSQ